MKSQLHPSERHAGVALLALTTAVLILVMAGVLFAGERDAPSVIGVPGPPTTTMSGWLHVVYGDAPRGGGHLHTHLLVDDRGRATQLAIPDSVVAAAGGREAINRRRVTVAGRLLPGPAATGSAGTPLVAVHSIVPDARQGVPGGPQGLSPALQGGGEALVSGSQKWASILCRFGDSPGVTPFPTSWFETLLLGSEAAPGLDHYWREVSFGTVNLTGSVVLGWYTLPQPRSYYVYGNPLQLDHQRAAEDCTAAADAEVHFPSFSGINLMFNDDLDCCAWGGSTMLVLDGQTKMYRVTWLPPWGYENQGPVAHEMGHGFGLPHSSGPYQATYDSRWDVMSDLWGNCPPWDSTYGCVGTHTISYHKDLLGWIPDNRRYVAAVGTSQTIALEPLDQLSASGFMIARIPIPGSTARFYTVETRRKIGYDGPLPGHAVVIHLVDTTQSDRDARVVDPDADGDPDDAGSMWLPGEAFVDSANDISVAVVGQTSNGFLVTVENGSAGPTPYILSVTVSGPGTVTSTPPGIACSAGTCSAGFSSDAVVTLTPSGAMSGWSGICAGAGLGPCDVIMNADQTAFATFAPPDITVSPLSHSFGTVAVGAKSQKTFTVHNDGAGALVFGTIKLGGINPDQFIVPAAQNFCAGRTLSPGESCTVLARFKPTSTGSKSAKLVIRSNDPDESPVKIPLSGDGSGAAALPRP